MSVEPNKSSVADIAARFLFEDFSQTLAQLGELPAQQALLNDRGRLVSYLEHLLYGAFAWKDAAIADGVRFPTMVKPTTGTWASRALADAQARAQAATDIAQASLKSGATESNLRTLLDSIDPEVFVRLSRSSDPALARRGILGAECYANLLDALSFHEALCTLDADTASGILSELQTLFSGPVGEWLRGLATE